MEKRVENAAAWLTCMAAAAIVLIFLMLSTGAPPLILAVAGVVAIATCFGALVINLVNDNTLASTVLGMTLIVEAVSYFGWLLPLLAL